MRMLKRNLHGGPTATSITPEQCRDARVSLGWTAGELAGLTSLDAITILRFESGDVEAVDHEPIIAAFAEYGGRYF